MTVNQKMVLGVGINDAGYVVKKNERYKDGSGKVKSRQTWVCPYYRRWMSMLYRVTPEHSRRRKSYEGVTICPDWVYFTRFKEWVEAQEKAFGVDEIAMRQLDKDILFPGNKVYSPSTCAFVLPETNYFFTDSRAARGDLPIGVSFHKGDQKFHARIMDGGANRFLGSFHCPNEAHSAWLSCKRALAHKVASREIDHRVKQAVVKFYDNYKTEKQETSHDNQ